MLQQALQTHYEKIVNAIDPGDTCLLSHQLSKLPGLKSQLKNTEILSELSVILGCQAHESVIRSSGSTLNYVTSLPACNEPVITEVSKATENSSEATNYSKQDITHILHEYNAYPLNKGRLYLSASGAMNISKSNDSHCSINLINGSVKLEPEGELTVFVNGRHLEHVADIVAGDIVSFIGSKTEYTFIHVSD